MTAALSRSLIRPLYRGFCAAFTPAELFRGGVKGVWFDPSDLSTLFQDAAGTIPVTGPDQPVGLILDKSFTYNGSGKHASQATNAKRPMLRTDGRLWWLESDGVDDFISTASPAIPATPPFTLCAGGWFSDSGVISGFITQYAAGQVGRVALTANQASSGAYLNGSFNPYYNDATNGGGYIGSPLNQAVGINTNFTLMTAARVGSEQTANYFNGVVNDRFALNSVYQGVGLNLLGDSMGSAGVKRLYSLVIVGQLTTDTQSRQLQSYCAVKSGVTL